MTPGEVYDAVYRTLELVAKGHGFPWRNGTSDIEDLLCHLAEPRRNLGCVIVTAVYALKNCDWPPEITEMLAAIPLDGRDSKSLREAFVAIETALHVHSR